MRNAFLAVLTSITLLASNNSAQALQVADFQTSATEVKPLAAITTESFPLFGSAPITFEVTNWDKTSAVEKWCISLDGQPATGAQISGSFGDVAALMGADGCLMPTSSATSPTLSAKLLTSSLSDGNHLLAATVTLAKSETVSVTASTKLQVTVNNRALAATKPNMSITGSLTAGQRIQASIGFWGADVSLTYQWYSGGQRIRGATSDKYLLTGADVGKLVSVQVTATRAGEPSLVSTLETSQTIGTQPSSSASQGSRSSTITSLQIVETNYLNQEISNYVVTIYHDQEVICTTTCNVSARATWSGTMGQSSSLSTTVYLRDPAGSNIASSSLYLTPNIISDDISFSIPSYSLSGGDIKDYALMVDSGSLGSRKTLTRLTNVGVTIIKGPNTSKYTQIASTFDSAVKSKLEESVFSGPSYSPEWAIWSLAAPSQIQVMAECMPVQIYAAPLSLRTGSADGTANYAADAKVTIRNQAGQIVESLAVYGSNGGWFNHPGYGLETKACGLNTKKGVREYLTVTVELSYDAFDLNWSTSRSFSVLMVGGLKWTSINCYKGTAGKVITGYKPVCPSGWTQTKAKVIGKKIQMTTLNCLKGTTVKVVKAPEPKCPTGYSVTTLKVNKGKLVPWTITCTKGVLVKKVTGVFPSCPSGYTKR